MTIPSIINFDEIAYLITHRTDVFEFQDSIEEDLYIMSVWASYIRMMKSGEVNDNIKSVLMLLSTDMDAGDYIGVSTDITADEADKLLTRFVEEA